MKQLSKIILITALLLTLILGGCNEKINYGDLQMISVHESVKHQQIDGFGASAAWWAQEIGGWSDVNRNKVVDLLFSRDNGIGLSIYRYNLGGGAEDKIEDKWRSSSTIEIEPGVFDLNADANAIWVMKAAKERGVEDFVVFANSPPARMTISGHAAGGLNGESNLSVDKYEEYAQYLIGAVKELRENGIPVKYISPINEPQWDWNISKGQEGCHYSIEECVAVVGVLDAEIKKDGIKNLSITAIEAGEWKDAIKYADAIFADDTLKASLNIFAGHSYWSGKISKLVFADKFSKRYPDKKLWMSEWTEMVEGREETMLSALTLANTVHEDMTILSANTWQYWIAVSKYNYRDGLIYTSANSEEIIETKRLYALGNYSRFVRPGFIRVDVTSKNNQVKASSYTDEAKKVVVLVLINNSPNEITQGIKLEKRYTKEAVYVTDETKNLSIEYIGDFQDYYTLSPKSVTTIILSE